MAENSPYFNEEHEIFRSSVHTFVEKEMAPHADEWEREGIFPRELFMRVEEVLEGHTAVHECCVVGRPDKRWGEQVVAVVVCNPDATVSAEELIEHCRAILPGFKTPKEVHFVSELPKSPVGKIVRREVRKPYWQEVAGSVHGAE